MRKQGEDQIQTRPRFAWVRNGSICPYVVFEGVKDCSSALVCVCGLYLSIWYRSNALANAFQTTPSSLGSFSILLILMKPVGRFVFVPRAATFRVFHATTPVVSRE